MSREDRSDLVGRAGRVTSMSMLLLAAILSVPTYAEDKNSEGTAGQVVGGIAELGIGAIVLRARPDPGSAVRQAGSQTLRDAYSEAVRRSTTASNAELRFDNAYYNVPPQPTRRYFDLVKGLEENYDTAASNESRAWKAYRQQWGLEVPQTNKLRDIHTKASLKRRIGTAAGALVLADGAFRLLNAGAGRNPGLVALGELPPESLTENIVKAHDTSSTLPSEAPAAMAPAVGSAE